MDDKTKTLLAKITETCDSEMPATAQSKSDQLVVLTGRLKAIKSLVMTEVAAAGVDLKIEGDNPDTLSVSDQLHDSVKVESEVQVNVQNKADKPKEQ